MSTAPRTGMAHPLVVAYLDDLDRALSGADPQERVDTVAAVTEHLNETLGGGAVDDAHVRAALDELGPVERIAAAATPAPPAPVAAPEEAGPWVATGLLVASVAALVLLPVLVWVSVAVVLGCLVTAVVLLRRGARSRGLLRATVVVSAVALVTSVVMAVALVAWWQVTGPSRPDVRPAVSRT